MAGYDVVIQPPDSSRNMFSASRSARNSRLGGFTQRGERERILICPDQFLVAETRNQVVLSNSSCL